jgi:hypothetical protein
LRTKSGREFRVAQRFSAAVSHSAVLVALAAAVKRLQSQHHRPQSDDISAGKTQRDPDLRQVAHEVGFEDFGWRGASALR